MKKRAYLRLTCVLLLGAALLAGCGGTGGALHDNTPTAADAGVAHPDLEPVEGEEDSEDIAPLPAESAPYDVAGNIHNGQTVVMDGAIFAQELGMLYRVDAATGEVRVLLDNESLGYRLPGPPALAAFDGYIYFLALKALTGDYDTGFQAELALFRADAEGGNVTEVALLEQGVYMLLGHEGYLVAYLELFDVPFGREGCRVFAPDGAADTLVEIDTGDLDDAWFERLARRYHWQTEEREVLARMGYGSENALFASAVRANDAYYVLDSYGLSLHRLPFGEGEPVPVPLADEAMEAMEGGWEAAYLANYDADWLYLRQHYSLYRLRRDGGAAELLVKGGVGQGWRIDVAGDRLFYTGTSGRLYMVDLVSGEATRLDPAPDGESVEVTLVANEMEFIVSPVLEADRQALAGELQISVGGGLEIVDEDDNPVHFTEVPLGARLLVAYTEFRELEGWDYPYWSVYRITVLA